MKRTLAECAQRIINGYREVCTMTPHVECKPEESSDHAVRLAVNYLATRPKWYTWDQVNRDVFDGDIWWYDNGDQIFPVNIAYSPTSQTFFACLGQWGWTRSQELSEMKGLWTPCIEPERQG